jgi:hypothetical protein
MKSAQKIAAKRLEPIVKTYEAEGTTKQCALRDLLTDVRHYSDAHDLDFFKALDGSYEVYCEERREQPRHA